MKINLKKNNFSYCYLASEQAYAFFHNLDFGYIYYRDYRLCLKTGKKQDYPIRLLIEKFDRILIEQDFKKPYLVHLAYEFGFVSQDLIEYIEQDTPLAIELNYLSWDKVAPHSEQKFKVDLKFDHASFEDYQKQFNKVYQYLLHGDCYQVNLTKRYQVHTQNALKLYFHNIMKAQRSHPAYEHGSYFPKIAMGLLSYSPECLFHLTDLCEKTMELTSMPIKGTKKRGKTSDFKLWKDLVQDEKEEAELNMITDLIRNDIASVCDYQSTVSSIKSPLVLPHILHQFSKVHGIIKKERSLMDLINALFPGGSITGAPKKNVMKIIKSIEASPRRFYCGSTLIFHQSLKKASINIRTIEFDFKTSSMELGSGGGITLKSQASLEFQEMEDKLQSILGYLQ